MISRRVYAANGAEPRRLQPLPSIDRRKAKCAWAWKKRPQLQVIFSFTSAASIHAGSLNGRESGKGRDVFVPGTELHLRVTELGGELDCALEYDAALFDEETARRILGHYQVLLQGIVANPQERISALPLLTGAERHQLIEEWNCARGGWGFLLSEISPRGICGTSRENSRRRRGYL